MAVSALQWRNADRAKSFRPSIGIPVQAGRPAGRRTRFLTWRNKLSRALDACIVDQTGAMGVATSPSQFPANAVFLSWGSRHH